jgi:hypothetical protein
MDDPIRPRICAFHNNAADDNPWHTSANHCQNFSWLGIVAYVTTLYFFVFYLLIIFNNFKGIFAGLQVPNHQLKDKLTESSSKLD